MLSVKRIVVPTDFSEPAREGFRRACTLAEHFGAELLVIHVIDPIPVIPTGHGAVPFNVEGYKEEVVRASKINLKQFIAQEKSAEVTTTPFVREGEVAEEIARAGDAYDADLIVMATHGYSGWKKFILGSVTEKVVRIAAIPVLTITAPYEKK